MSSAATAPDPTTTDADGLKAALRSMHGETVTLVSRWGENEPVSTRQLLHYPTCRAPDVSFKHLTGGGQSWLSFPWDNTPLYIGSDRLVIEAEDVTWEIIREV